MTEIRLRRAYEEPGPMDGQRILVDRVWPRGISKEDLELDAWLKDIAPSDALREWFGHDPGKWGAFKDRYTKELDEREEAVAAIRERCGEGRVTLVYGAKDEKRNNAVALKDYLESP